MGCCFCCLDEGAKVGRVLEKFSADREKTVRAIIEKYKGFAKEVDAWDFKDFVVIREKEAPQTLKDDVKTLEAYALDIIVYSKPFVEVVGHVDMAEMVGEPLYKDLRGASLTMTTKKELATEATQLQATMVFTNVLLTSSDGDMKKDLTAWTKYFVSRFSFTMTTLGEKLCGRIEVAKAQSPEKAREPDAEQSGETVATADAPKAPEAGKKLRKVKL